MTDSRREIIVLPDAAAVARRAAEEIMAASASPGGAGANGDAPFTLALAGGSTPKRLYEMFADKSLDYRARLPWRRTHIFWGDERHVPPEHADSNFRMTREALFGAQLLPEQNIHRILAENPDANRVAEEYEKELRFFFRLSPGAFPRFDVMLLGMGADGHTASLFPGTTALAEVTRLVSAPWVEKFKTHRITLTAPVFNHARLVLFLVTGEDKAATLKEVLEGERDPQRLPSQLIAPAGRCRWLVDAAAARLLSRREKLEPTR